MERNVLILCVMALFMVSCGGSRRLKELSRNNVSAALSIAGESGMRDLSDSLPEVAPQDRVAVVDRLGKVYVMDAEKDDEYGEMVISDKLSAVVVEARFLNVAERNGYVDLAFDVKVPKEMIASDWQVRMTPVLDYLGRRVQLDKILITGSRYREAQLRGYELYEKFLNSIIPEDADFISTYTHRRLLELFIERNFKEVAKLKGDTSFVDAAIVSNLFGVTKNEVVDHYTRGHLIRRNERRIADKERMFAKYVKVPIEKGGVRLDSVLHNPDSSLLYRYTHTIKAKRGLKRVDLTLGGEIYRSDKCIYTMAAAEPLTYYISSLTYFAERSVRYIKRVVERNLTANTISYIDFRTGSHEICDTLRNNYAEIGLLKKNIANILGDKSYVVDSLLITASCSPEGTLRTNEMLARMRAWAVREYFKEHVKSHLVENNSEYWELSLEGGMAGADKMQGARNQSEELDTKIRTGWIAEGWERLQGLIRRDSLIADKEFMEMCFEIADPDKRESKMMESPSYGYIRDELYPLLRCVKFDFYMHRKGMLKDTVHTTEIDTSYMAGVAALVDMDYGKAVTLLRPYRDLNSAVALLCMDYNGSALEVLNALPESAASEYMKSVAYARLGNGKRAVECFMRSVECNPSMRHRGNLDPEIAHLLKEYNLH